MRTVIKTEQTERKTFSDECAKSFGGKRVRLVAGVDANTEFGSNAIFYVRTECRQRGKRRVKVPEMWLSLSELTRLSMLMSLSTRFWFETLEKRRSSTSRRVREFQRAWNTVQNAIVDLLPA